MSNFTWTRNGREPKGNVRRAVWMLRSSLIAMCVLGGRMASALRSPGSRALLATCLFGALLEQAAAQRWSDPFNHNEAYNGYGDYSHPFSPWNSPTYIVNYPTAAGMLVQPPPEVLVLGAQVFGWPQPQFFGGPSFNAVHMSLIPKGPYRGMVIVWNRDERIMAKWPVGGSNYFVFQAYAIVDPADVPLNGIRYRNFVLPIAPFVGAQDLFCAAHAWSPFGDLIVVGGTDYYAVGGHYYSGGRLVFAWNPRLAVAPWPFGGGQFYDPSPAFGFFGVWQPGPTLEHRRWYPTAMLTHRLSRAPASSPLSPPRERMVVLGGTESVPPPPSPAPGILEARNSYEALVIEAEADQFSARLAVDDTVGTPNPIRTWIGCGTTGGAVQVDWLAEYPRCHLLSTGRLFFSGYAPRWAIVDHDAAPGVWTRSMGQTGQPPGTYSSNWQDVRHAGSSVLFPNFGGNFDVIARIAGLNDAGTQTTASMESIAVGGNGNWQPGPDMLPVGDSDGGRVSLNTVILPTGALLVLGGTNITPSATQSAYMPMLFENGTWNKCDPNPISSKRNYHSTAVLLPDGRVFVGGGDDRDYDYEIFSPPYIDNNALRPVNLTWQTPAPVFDALFNAHVLQYGQLYPIFRRIEMAFLTVDTGLILHRPCRGHEAA